MKPMCDTGRALRSAEVLACARVRDRGSFGYCPDQSGAGIPWVLHRAPGKRSAGPVCAGLGVLMLVLVAGCAGNAAPASAAESSAAAAAPEHPESRTVSPDVSPVVSSDPGVPEPREGAWIRLSGDPSLVAERRGDFYFFGTASITTELPDGYPPPTPPGAMDLKRYPSVRRAEVSGRSNPDLGTNIGFFPLFNHIQRRRIAMTSPVEVDYRPAGAGESPQDVEWTMSFLYRSADLGPTGIDERDRRVRIVDTEPVTVVSVGLQGPYRLRRMMEAVKEIEAWLLQNPQWEVAGEPRALYYNGPEQPDRNKWAEAQVPVRRRSAVGTPLTTPQ